MKTLFLAPRLPLPADTGGKIRTFNLLRQVAKFCQVHLVCFSFEVTDINQLDHFADMHIPVTLVPTQATNLARQAWKLLTDPCPYSVLKYRQTAMATAVKDLSQKNHFDLLHIDHIHMAHYINDVPDLPAVIDEHNVEYKILERCVNVAKNPLKKMMYLQQAQKMKQFEKDLLPRVKTCTAVSQQDAEILQKLTAQQARVEILPNGVDTEYFSTPAHQRTSVPEIKTGSVGPWESGAPATEEALVFTGSMDWLPNEDAVIYFFSQILPLIRKRKPQVIFYVVGKNPSAAIQKLCRQDSQIVLTGCVPDVRGYLQRAKVFVVPLRIGGGTRLKILEAMSMQNAVVSTSIGAEGIAHTDGRNIALADTPETFAEKVISLLDNPERANQIGQAGRQLVLQNYDWNLFGQKLRELYTELTHGK
jgi:polysaccharide biosynthesis protein PslH